jgi:hypothetical protein
MLYPGQRTLLTPAILVVSGMAFGAGIMWLWQAGSDTVPNNLSAHKDSAQRRESAHSNNALSHGAAGSLQPNALGDESDHTLKLETLDDIQNALHQGGAIVSPKAKLDYYRKVFKAWAELDPEGAAAYALNAFPPGQLQAETVGIALNKWGAKDSRAAWEWSENNLTGPLKDQAQNDIMVGWTRKSPAVASAWLSSTGSTSQSLHAAVSRTWAERDPVAALNWANGIKKPQLQKAMLALAANVGVGNSPEKVIAFVTPRINGLPQTPDRSTGLKPNLTGPSQEKLPEEILSPIVEGWAPNDPVATARWLETLPDGPYKFQAAATLATIWAASDIKAAIAWASTIRHPEMRRQVITHIAGLWASNEPDLALRWLQRLPPTDAFEGIIEAYNVWAATDPIGLGSYISTNAQPSPTMDQPRISLAEVLTDSNVAQSIQLALGLSNPSNRDDALARYFRHWRKVDDQSAQEWLQRIWSSLSPTTQKRLSAEQNRPVIAR